MFLNFVGYGAILWKPSNCNFHFEKMIYRIIDKLTAISIFKKFDSEAIGGVWSQAPRVQRSLKAWIELDSEYFAKSKICGSSKGS